MELSMWYHNFMKCIQNLLFYGIKLDELASSKHKEENGSGKNYDRH